MTPHETPPSPPAPPAADPAARVTGLPDGWSTRRARPTDGAALHTLLARHETAAKGGASTGRAEVDARLGSPAQRHVVALDPAGRALGWATAHDRAAGRVLVATTVDPDLDAATADALASALLGWAGRCAGELARARGLATTQVDTGAFVGDARQEAWLRAAGFTRTRTWLQMSRPVTSADGAPDAFPAPHPDVRLRRVRRGADGMPHRDDVVAVHDVLERAFVDHFNHHEETFEEFYARLREDPGHRWDHWWLAEVRDDGTAAPARDGAA